MIYSYFGAYPNRFKIYWDYTPDQIYLLVQNIILDITEGKNPTCLP